MRNQLWDLLCRMKYSEIYARYYRNRISFWDTVTTIFLSLIAAGSIAGWFIWSQIPEVWSSLLAASQVIQIVRQHLPFSTHRFALKYYIPALSKLVVEYTNVWNTCDMEDDDACAKLHHHYLKLFIDMDSQYFGDTTIKRYKGLEKKAEEECDLFIKAFDTTQGGEIDNACTKTTAEAK